MSFELAPFVSGFGVVIIGFLVAWALGLVAKMFNVADD